MFVDPRSPSDVAKALEVLDRRTRSLLYANICLALMVLVLAFK